MMDMALLRGAISSLSMVFGGLGVFFVYYSFMRPEMAVYALIFLGSATAITWSAPK